MLEWMKRKNVFPAILLLRRYLKLVARYCDENALWLTPVALGAKSRRREVCFQGAARKRVSREGWTGGVHIYFLRISNAFSFCASVISGMPVTSAVSRLAAIRPAKRCQEPFSPIWGHFAKKRFLTSFPSSLALLHNGFAVSVHNRRR